MRCSPRESLISGAPRSRRAAKLRPIQAGKSSFDSASWRPATHTSLTMSRPPEKTNCRNRIGERLRRGPARSMQHTSAHLPVSRVPISDSRPETRRRRRGWRRRARPGRVRPPGRRRAVAHEKSFHFASTHPARCPQWSPVAAEAQTQSRGARAPRSAPLRPRASSSESRHSVTPMPRALREIEIRGIERAPGARRSSAGVSSPRPLNAFERPLAHVATAIPRCSLCDSCSETQNAGVELVGQDSDARKRRVADRLGPKRRESSRN